MKIIKSVEDLVNNIKEFLDSDNKKKKKRIAILYAFNSTGKTRFSNTFSELFESKVLCYNAFVEDLFVWDNENYVIHFDSKSWIANLIDEQGIENDIIENFKITTNSKIEPLFDIKNSSITFKIATGDDSTVSNIKISKGEESIFIWSLFYTILTTLIDNLNENEDDRQTDYFNNIEYVIIDDPVSSLDDTKIITMALKLIDSIYESKNNKLKFIITTHHALFYNILYNSYKINCKCFTLSKNNSGFFLKENNFDSPFGYHLEVIDEIAKAIQDNNIKKYHFNLFRGILEKTANFHGFKKWGDCITSESNKQEFDKLINHYSHDRLSELESGDLPNDDIELFKNTFNNFVFQFFKKEVDD